MFVLVAVVMLTLGMHGCEVFIQIWLSAWTGRGAKEGQLASLVSVGPSNNLTEEGGVETRQMDSLSKYPARDHIFYGVFAGMVLGIVLLTSANAVSFFIIAIRYSINAYFYRYENNSAYCLFL